MTATIKQDLYNLSLKELTDFITNTGEKPYRAKQLYRWLYEKGITDINSMTDIPESSRAKLNEIASNNSLEIVDTLKSKDASTEKHLLKTLDNHYIETVFMKYKKRNSICISSQVGCRMGCTFCASGSKGLIRNLTPAEMTLQVILSENESNERIKNIVIMGIGEPLDNFENVKKFIENITSDFGRDLSRRAITLSTCGLVPMIEKLADELPQVNLAVSLHAPNDELRNKIMPISRKYDIASLIKAVKYHYEKTKRRSTFEYTLIEGFNDSEACAKELVTLIRGMNCLVNIIPLNKATEGKQQSSNVQSINKFHEVLSNHHIPATIRRSLGEDIDAACGQLMLKKISQ